MLGEPVEDGLVACLRLILGDQRPAIHHEDALRHRALALEAQQGRADEPGVAVLHEADPRHVETASGRVAVGGPPLLEDQVIHRRQHLPWHRNAGRAGVGGDVVLLKVPEVDIDLQPVLVEDAEALEGVQERPRRYGQRPLHLGLVVVIGYVEALVNGVDDVRHGDVDAVVPIGREVLGVIEGHLAGGLGTAAHGLPRIRRRIQHDGVGGHRQSAGRPRGFHLKRSAHRLGHAGEGVVPDGWVVQVTPDVRAVNVAKPADRVPRCTLRPHPQVADGQFALAGDLGLTQRPGRLGPGDQVLRHAGEGAVGREAVLHRRDPDPHGVLHGNASGAFIELVPLGLVGKLAGEDALANLVKLLVLVLPEARLAPSGHAAGPGRGELVDGRIVIADGGGAAPALGVDVPLKRLWV